MMTRNVSRYLLISNAILFLLLCVLLINEKPGQRLEQTLLFRCSSHAEQNEEIIIKDMKSVAALTNDIKYKLEILRVNNRSSSIADLHCLIQHRIQELDKLLEVDKWHKELSRNISKRIKATIDSIQNPVNCSAVPKLYCDVRNPAGLASGVHDILWCAHNAYLRRSMLVIMAGNWHYTPKGWKHSFQELSHKCLDQVRTETQTQWPGICEDKYRYPLVHLPEDIAGDLRLLGSNPLPWWYGQLLGNLVKPSRRIGDIVEHNMKTIGFQSPIVGLHIRRTDKIGVEGAFHAVSEYMAPVKNYYDTLSISGETLDERRVFVATDDPASLAELQTNYPEYKFLFNKNSAKVVENLRSRYAYDGLESAIVDLFMISRVDYLVCSLSSGFSRLAYELMLYNNPDGLNQMYSVDTEYYYAGAANPPRVALYDHIFPDDPELKKGDILVQPYFTSLQDDASKGKIYDGFTRALNKRTGQTGLFPLYKTKLLFQNANVTTNYTK